MYKFYPNKSYLIKLTKNILFLFIFLSLSLCSSEQEKTVVKNNFPLKNRFYPKSDKIDFNTLTVTPFRFVTSSCVSDKFCGHNLFDSNKSSLWITKNSNKDEWLIIDFGKKRLMNGIQIDFSPACHLQTYYVQVLKRWKWENIFQGECSYKAKKQTFGNIDASILRIYFPKNKTISYKVANVKILLNESILTGIPNRLTSYTFPVKDGVMPEDDYSLPGAPRTYRNGIHKGVDIRFKKVNENAKIPLTEKDLILAAHSGIVVRADKLYQPIKASEYDELTSYNQKNPVTFVDRDFGGRQIWIDHGNGVMTSYNHLSKIAPNIKEGTKVQKGEIIGYAGNSGLKGEAYGNKNGIHLHFEIWIDGEYAGKGLTPEEVRKFLQYFFTE